MTLSERDFPTDHHGWSELLPPRQACNSMQGTLRVPWVVVGAGLTGLACARRLAELHPNDEIILLDARLVGQGASGRNSGFAVGVSHFPGAFKPEQKENVARVNRINQAGLDILGQQIKSLAINCQWDDSGFHHGAADTISIKEHKYFIDYLNAMDVEHSSLDQQAMEGRFGTSLYQAGVHVKPGALVQPAALVRGLGDHQPNNVRLIENCPVLKVEFGIPTRLRLLGGEIKADKLVLATNYEAPKLGFLRRRLIGSTLSGSFTRKLTSQELATLGSHKTWGIISLHGGGATIRLTADGRICLRNTAEYSGGVLLSPQALDARQATHRSSFEKRFPQLVHVPFEYAWSGVEGISGNGTNFFGQQRKNIYLAGGYNGSGVSRGTAFGYALAEYAGGGQSDLITDCLGSTAATWLPPRPFLDVGAMLKISARFRGVGLDR
ncbi:MAG TPA: FAD-binding oxidoreductase [Porticoccaceae bacterium]|nr:FAD-binding oxidoreductase [Porticoccaceae bacterium]HIK80104.1 FAD-binding oxidoreductase [Porticoccaceae bacterium]